MTKITRNGVTRETNDKKRKKENPNGKQRKGYLYLGSSARERERERERDTHDQTDRWSLVIYVVGDGRRAFFLKVIFFKIIIIHAAS